MHGRVTETAQPNAMNAIATVVVAQVSSLASCKITKLLCTQGKVAIIKSFSTTPVVQMIVFFFSSKLPALARCRCFTDSLGAD